MVSLCMSPSSRPRLTGKGSRSKTNSGSEGSGQPSKATEDEDPSAKVEKSQVDASTQMEVKITRESYTQIGPLKNKDSYSQVDVLGKADAYTQEEVFKKDDAYTQMDAFQKEDAYTQVDTFPKEDAYSQVDTIIAEDASTQVENSQTEDAYTQMAAVAKTDAYAQAGFSTPVDGFTQVYQEVVDEFKQRIRKSCADAAIQTDIKNGAALDKPNNESQDISRSSKTSSQSDPTPAKLNRRREESSPSFSRPSKAGSPKRTRSQSQYSNRETQTDDPEPRPKSLPSISSRDKQDSRPMVKKGDKVCKMLFRSYKASVALQKPHIANYRQSETHQDSSGSPLDPRAKSPTPSQAKESAIDTGTTSLTQATQPASIGSSQISPVSY